uniref:Putative conserved plasma membrane protein n=1 Tax=Ixodes ricinus TaxID=34613 RepID=A0A090XDM9_IXORI
MATTAVRQTTTVTSSSSSSPVVVSFNTSFITSIGGLFTILELVLGTIVFSLMYNYGGFVYPSGIFLLLVSFAYWLICFYFLLSAMLSITGSLLPSTYFFFLFLCVWVSVLYISGGIAVLAVYSRYASSVAGIIAAAVFGVDSGGLSSRPRCIFGTKRIPNPGVIAIPGLPAGTKKCYF